MDSRRVVILAMLITGGVIVVADARKGSLPRPRNLIALGVVFVVLAGLADAEPRIAVPMAALVATGTVVTVGVDAFGGLTALVQGQTGLGSHAQANAIVTVPGGLQVQTGQGQDGDAQASPAAERAVRFARAQIGVPYVWGGESHSVGFDCSGLCQAAYRAAGVSIPRTSQEQQTSLPRVAVGQLAQGDLVFSNFEGGGDASHVVLYAGGNRCIAAPHTGTVVQYEPLSTFTGGVFRGCARPAQGAANTTASQLAGAHR